MSCSVSILAPVRVFQVFTSLPHQTKITKNYCSINKIQCCNTITLTNAYKHKPKIPQQEPIVLISFLIDRNYTIKFF